MNISKQESGNNSTNLQAGGDITVQNSTIALYSIEELSLQLLESVFGELSAEAKLQIKQNQQSYFNALTLDLQKIVKTGVELKRVIDSPDFQYISKKAAISASRSSSESLHKTLSSLIVQRVNVDNEDLKRVVYNEAISTVEKLTIDQLKILAISFLLTRTRRQNLKTLGEFRTYLEQVIGPFIDFKGTVAEFEHLVYSGCASIVSILSTNLSEVLKGNYPEVFQSTGIPESLLAESEVAAKLFTSWKDTQIRSVELTSVGIVIASTFIGQVTGARMDINIWIN